MFTTKSQARLTGYSFDMMIVTWNQQITKVGTSTSQQSKTCQDKSGLSMIAF